MSMTSKLPFLCNRPLGRGPYLALGVGFFAVKFAIDWCLARLVFDRTWSPLEYLIWPNDRTVRVFELPPDERNFGLAMLAISLPFICIGLLLTVRRLRGAELPLWLSALFFVPFINLLLFALLSVLPSREPATEAEIDPDAAPLAREAAFGVPDDLETKKRSAIFAVTVSVPVTVALTAIAAVVLQSYGFGIFVGAPFTLGLISTLLFGMKRPQRLGDCLFVATSAAAVACMLFLALGLEGIICLLMAAPIALVLAVLGGLVGYVIQARPWLNQGAGRYAAVLLCVLPAMMAAEAADEPLPTLRAVHTAVDIAAPPERVWQHVIRFPPLDEPRDWLFRAGVAYPQRAEIHGTGLGAVRHCVFSTGSFVEPIDVWNPPHELRFRVTDQPEPMREWSPYAIHPPHLHGYLVSQQGRFELISLADGGTRLVGTTWYTNRMWPAPYWGLWSDYIIRSIHRRVLVHICELAEK